MFTQVSKILFRAILLLLCANLRNLMNIYQTFFPKCSAYLPAQFCTNSLFPFCNTLTKENWILFRENEPKICLNFATLMYILEKRGWTLSKRSVTTQKRQFVLDKVQIGTLHMLYLRFCYLTNCGGSGI
jgi:hypothetical protein